METLLGLTASQWFLLLKENRFKINPFKLPVAIGVTALAFRNSMLSRREIRQFGDQLANIRIQKPPIFILGHWRSGTTLLFQLMTADPQFAFPHVVEIFNPFTFLTIEQNTSLKTAGQRTWKRPMDNVKVSLFSPGEEEFALGMLSLRSPLLSWTFPLNTRYYDQFLSFKTASPEDRERWKASYLYFLKKLTFRYQKQLLLKSPPNTARIQLLLELFPEAKFIHIHRHPLKVFRSTLHLYKKSAFRLNLQRTPSDKEIEDTIIRRYKLMYDAFWEDVPAIPEGNFIDISFEELVHDFEATIQTIYQKLHIEGFDIYHPYLKEKIATLQRYKTNSYPEVTPEQRQRIQLEWEQYYSRWGYKLNESEMVK